jgi:hypothetical protein
MVAGRGSSSAGPTGRLPRRSRAEFQRGDPPNSLHSSPMPFGALAHVGILGATCIRRYPE